MASGQGVEVSSKERLRRIDIPVPNPALAEWLFSPECQRLVADVTSEIFVAYQNSLPVVSGELRDSAYWRVGHGGWGSDQDRWFGYVGNRAPYARVIEYGATITGVRTRKEYKRVPGGRVDESYLSVRSEVVTRRIEGQHQLRDAVDRITGGGFSAPRVPRRRQLPPRDARGRFTKRNT